MHTHSPEEGHPRGFAVDAELLLRLRQLLQRLSDLTSRSATRSSDNNDLQAATRIPRAGGNGSPSWCCHSKVVNVKQGFRSAAHGTYALMTVQSAGTRFESGFWTSIKYCIQKVQITHSRH